MALEDTEDLEVMEALEVTEDSLVGLAMEDTEVSVMEDMVDLDVVKDLLILNL